MLLMKQQFSLLVILVYFTDTYGKPIDVTGKNIKFYKLTPNEGSGNYDFNYGTKDGAQRSERGFIKKEEGSGRPLLTVTGTFKYSDTDGEVHEVSYIADEQGYRVVPKEEVEELHKKLTNENEILPSSETLTPPAKSSSSAPARVTLSSSELPPPLPSSQFPSLAATPTTESQIIKLKVINPTSDKPILCPPGKCSGARQSKIFKIKSLKIG